MENKGKWIKRHYESNKRKKNFSKEKLLKFCKEMKKNIIERKRANKRLIEM